jgi:hypothetical protein
VAYLNDQHHCSCGLGPLLTQGCSATVTVVTDSSRVTKGQVACKAGYLDTRIPGRIELRTVWDFIILLRMALCELVNYFWNFPSNISDGNWLEGETGAIVSWYKVIETSGSRRPVE